MLFLVCFSPPLSPFSFLPQNTWAMPKRQREGVGNGGRQGSRCSFTRKPHPGMEAKITPVNYIITAASRERTGIQVAIVFIGMLLERQSSRPCLLTPFPSIFAQTSPGSAPTFNVCPLHLCVRKGLLGDKGTKGKELRRRLSCTKRRACELFKVIIM